MGSVAKFELSARLGDFCGCSDRGDEGFELFGDRQAGSVIAQHVDHLDARQCCNCGSERLKAEHQFDASLDPPVILLDAVVQILTLSDADGFKPAARTILEAADGVTGNDRFTVGLAAVDNDAFRPAMPSERLFEEAFGGRKVTMLAEPELDCASVAVDGPIEICPTTANLDTGRYQEVVSTPMSNSAIRSGEIFEARQPAPRARGACLLTATPHPI